MSEFRARRVIINSLLIGMGATGLAACSNKPPAPLTLSDLSPIKGFYDVNRDGTPELIPGHCYTVLDPAHMTPAEATTFTSGKAVASTVIVDAQGRFDVSAALKTVDLTQATTGSDKILNVDGTDRCADLGAQSTG